MPGKFGAKWLARAVAVVVAQTASNGQPMLGVVAQAQTTLPAGAPTKLAPAQRGHAEELRDSGGEVGPPNRSAADAPPTSLTPPLTQPLANSSRPFAEAVCITLGQEALANDLPAAFFTRLIWQESRFNPNARSHAGAEGIAQFMPGTARWRGLGDSYDPFEALRASARWLAELKTQFGNLGLAAAAYNAGPGRVQAWLARGGYLPAETRAYVRIITGRSAEDWAQGKASDSDMMAKNTIPCTQIAKLLVGHGVDGAATVAAQAPAREKSAQAALTPWGVQLTGDWSKDRALADYRKLQKKFPALLGQRLPLVLGSPTTGRGSAPWYRVRVGEATRERAAQLCAKLEAAGGQCLVFRN